MTYAQAVCLGFTAATIYGFGVTSGRREEMSMTQIIGYLIMIAFGATGAFWG